MKLNELRQIIKEEAKKALNEGIVENIRDEIKALTDKHRKLKGTTCYVVTNKNGRVYGVYKNKKLAEEAKKIASFDSAYGGLIESAYIKQSNLY
jgi:predicted metal-dependent phosphoesterase TrpH